MRRSVYVLLVALGVAAANWCEGQGIRPYVALDGKEIAPDGVQVSRSEERIRVTFTAPRPGRCSFGLSIEARALTPMVPGPEPISAEGVAKPVVLRYPYDWTCKKQGNVLNARPRLVMPGVVAEGKYYVVDTHELWSLRIDRTANGLIRALLLKHRMFNDGGDAATTELDMDAGQQEHLDILVFDSIAEANRTRFGTAERLRGRMTQIAFRGWPGRNLSKEEYERIAERFRGVFDYVIIREIKPHDWIPPLFHSRGIRVLHYQFLGALRRHSSQVSEAVERDIGMKDQESRRYTAPKSPDGSWLLCDVRRGDVRARLVGNARKAVASGFDGVFLDGPTFWADASGRRGGYAPDATRSLAWARWRLLREIRSALHGTRPGAILGILGNQYYDTLGEADFIVKERMYFAWDSFARQFDERRTVIRQDLDVDYETGQAIYAARNVCYGVKGFSPISVQSALHFIRKPTGLTYFGTGDFFPNRLDDWLRTVMAIATQDDLYIKAIQPADVRVHFEGRATIWADTKCRVTFSHPVCLLRNGNDRHAHQLGEATLLPQQRYRVLQDCQKRD